MGRTVHQVWMFDDHRKVHILKCLTNMSTTSACITLIERSSLKISKHFGFSIIGSLKSAAVFQTAISKKDRLDMLYDQQVWPGKKVEGTSNYKSRYYNEAQLCATLSSLLLSRVGELIISRVENAEYGAFDLCRLPACVLPGKIDLSCLAKLLKILYCRYSEKGIRLRFPVSNLELSHCP